MIAYLTYVYSEASLACRWPMKTGWFTGSGQEIEFDDLLVDIHRYLQKGGRVFVGSDSQLSVDKCIFVSAICLHGAHGTMGGKYFFRKFKEHGSQYKILKLRIMKEVNYSIEIAADLIERYPQADIEVHIDIGSSEKSQTRKYVDEFTGWTKASGFSCKTKPHAWASASVADKHTK